MAFLNRAISGGVAAQKIARGSKCGAPSFLQGAGFGAFGGAAAGAIIGAIAGDAGLCAAIGTASGALGGGAYRGLSSNEQYKSAYINCMRDPRPQGDQLIGGDSKSRASNPGSINIYGQGFGCRV